MLACHREPHNRENLFAVGVYEDATLVGHVPRKFSCVLALFKARRNNNVPSYWLEGCILVIYCKGDWDYPVCTF